MINLDSTDSVVDYRNYAICRRSRVAASSHPVTIRLQPRLSPSVRACCLPQPSCKPPSCCPVSACATVAASHNLSLTTAAPHSASGRGLLPCHSPTQRPIKLLPRLSYHVTAGRCLATASPGTGLLPRARYAAALPQLAPRQGLLPQPCSHDCCRTAPNKPNYGLTSRSHRIVPHHGKTEHSLISVIMI
ncbi:hypothetical protein JYU34_018764 [Plutella xylostella]|uniref:Uncharacterized protein n=1 Tax=Plutella xylostella TaxID=51655 RepID=A0ABQ7PYF1_PLUXY|nr:hypothetical protein JYU34_018764 [Plutella xylostella]